MGDRRAKKIRSYVSSQSLNTEDLIAGRSDELGRDMGRTKHKETSTVSSRDSSSREQKRKRPTRERWLLTRKTWRYMADAGRRLIPDGAQNRAEDIPKIEAYFQEVCHREPKFLLWRKSSYPGALGFRSHPRKNRRQKGGSCREKASSADEAETSQASVTNRRLDLKKMKEEFLYGSTSSGSDAFITQKHFSGCQSPLLEVPETTVTSPDNEEEETERELMETLSKYLRVREESTDTLSTGEEPIDIDYQRLADQLRKYLSTSNILEEESEVVAATEGRKAVPVRTLTTTTQRPLSPTLTPPRFSFEADTPERMALKTFRRYYSKSTCRQKVITDLLTDRKLLEKLYFGLRQTRNYKTVSGGAGRDGSGFSPRWTSPEQTATTLRTRREGDDVCKDGHNFENSMGTLSWKHRKTPSRDPRELSLFSPPPLIEIEDEYERDTVDKGIQTDPIPASVLVAIEDELKKARESAAQEGKEDRNASGAGWRRSSVDNDDVSPSVSDTIKRYLRMARKKSLDADKADRFKRVNYDRNLRNIKAKGEITMPGDDDGLSKGCQPDESWITALKELKLEDISSDPEMSPAGDEYSGSRVTSSRSSLEGAGISDDGLLSPPPTHVGGKFHSTILSTGHNFLSNLLHGLQHHQQLQQCNEEFAGMTQSSACTATPVGGAMQKSKSSSSVVHHGSRVAKKIWRGRSKSQSRATSSATSTWTPQGHCTWTNVTGRHVTLTDTSLLTLCEVERRMLQKVAIAKLQALNLGVTVRIPSETVVTVSHKPKRRPYLLKRKALTTGIFDTTRGKDDKDKDNAGGLVFGIPIGQCLENDRLSRIQRGGSPGRDEPSELRRKSHHGSRTSFSSLIETTGRGDESGSYESLMSPGDRMAGSVPGLLDSLSCGSTADISTADRDPSIPQIAQACFRHLENFGLHTLGIFRVSSSKKRVRQLREDFDCGKDTTLGEDHCPHDVATLLKEYFRDLPEPLLCRDLYQAFIQTQMDKHQTHSHSTPEKEPMVPVGKASHIDVLNAVAVPPPIIRSSKLYTQHRVFVELFLFLTTIMEIRNRRLQFEALQHLTQLLPVPNRDTLWALLNFLVMVARNAGDYKDETGELSSGNKMDSNNLATVFAPNILHCIKPGSNKELSTERAEERIDVITVIRSMIDHNKELFQISAELLDEVYLHMMDSHPDALDYLLRKRGNLGDELIDDLEISVTEGVSIGDIASISRTPTLIGSETQDHQLGTTFSETEDQLRNVRRVWTREEFLHETAGMGGPDVSMRPRHKDRDRGRERSSKKRWKEETNSRRKTETHGGTDFPKTAFSITTSASASQISMSGHQKACVISQQPINTAAKMRSASVDGGTTLTAPLEHGDLLERTYDDENDNDSSRRQSSSLLSDSGIGGDVITASLKIPVPSATSSASFALNLDDADIPYIEDGGGGSGGGGGGGGGGGFSISTDSGRQHVAIGLVRRAGSGDGTNNANRRRRQRSASGSDSSQASTGVHPPGSLSTLFQQQQGCDSALGSTATFSSPPHNTPSICSSDAGQFSSPPSWASSPPTSPDAMGTTVNFIPEELTSRIQHQSQTARISITTSPKVISQHGTPTAQAVLQKISKEVAPVILQKVTLTSTSELQQVQRSDTTNDRQPDIRGSKLAIHKVQTTAGELPKSASTSAVISSHKKSVDFEIEPTGSERKLTTSISSIGGAVMKSKTADIERMLRIKGNEASKLKTVVTEPQQMSAVEDKKKYSKRRYTDSRHQTRYIPDSEALQEGSSGGERGTVSHQDATITQQRKSQQGPVWKRRELIASDPKNRESAL